MRAWSISERNSRLALWTLAALQLATGLYMAIAPGSFFDQIAGYGVRNDHFIRDIATFMIALGAGFAVAAVRPAWRLPVLSVAALQYALHWANHLADIGNADRHSAGPINAVVIGLAGFGIVWLLVSETRRARL